MSDNKWSQEMTNREYLEDQDAEEPDDFVITLTAQVSFLKNHTYSSKLAHFFSIIYNYHGVVNVKF